MSKTNKKALIQEAVVRRWGTLANIKPLTETFLDGNELYEEEEEEVVGVEDEVTAELPDAEAPEATPEESEAVEAIVTAVVDAISAETGIDIEVEGEVDAGAEELPGGEEEVEDVEMEVGMEDEEDLAANRGPYNRKDITERGDKKEGGGVDETLNLDVIDDEELTEAVLKRVVTRLLRRK